MDADGNGTIEMDEIGHALATCGLKIPQYKVRMLIDDIAKNDDKNQDGKIDMSEFKNVSICIRAEQNQYLYKSRTKSVFANYTCT